MYETIWRVQYRAPRHLQWCYDGHFFATEDEAKRYAFDNSLRCPSHKFRVKKDRYFRATHKYPEVHPEKTELRIKK
jgi:hypothetical protein